MKLKSSIRKAWPIMVSVGSAGLMVLAFFIPSLQDQWDRYQSRGIIQKYEELGNDLFEDELYEMAEKAYEKAFELSEEKRLDIEVKRLSARVYRINGNEEWGSPPPEDLQDIDFQFLLYFLKNEENKLQRVPILTGYSVYLSGLDRLDEAKKVLDEALSIDPTNELVYINLGNLSDQQGNKEEAEKFYLKAIKIDSTNVQAHYNLGLLYGEQDKFIQAADELRKALLHAPSDSVIKKEYELILSHIKQQ